MEGDHPDTVPGFMMQSQNFVLKFITGLQKGVVSKLLEMETDWLVQAGSFVLLMCILMPKLMVNAPLTWRVVFRFDMMEIMLSRLEDEPTNRERCLLVSLSSHLTCPWKVWRDLRERSWALGLASAWRGYAQPGDQSEDYQSSIEIKSFLDFFKTMQVELEEHLYKKMVGNPRNMQQHPPKTGENWYDYGDNLIRYDMVWWPDRWFTILHLTCFKPRSSGFKEVCQVDV